MKLVRCLSVSIAICALVLVALPAAADHHEQEMSAEEQAMMEAWMKAGTPGEEHAWLASRAGTWKVTVKMFMPGAEEPQTSEGTAERKMIMGGRVLKETFSGTWQGQPFEGIGMTGYDNVTGKYWSTWFDNMSTGLYVSEGEMGEDGKMMMKGDASDPMTGGTKEMKWVSHAEADKEVNEAWEMYEGESMKTMELVYERAE